MFRKALTVNFKTLDPDHTAAEKQLLRIIIMITTVIIIILWYNKDIRLLIRAQWGVQ